MNLSIKKSFLTCAVLLFATNVCYAAEEAPVAAEQTLADARPDLFMLNPDLEFRREVGFVDPVAFTLRRSTTLSSASTEIANALRMSSRISKNDVENVTPDNLVLYWQQIGDREIKSLIVKKTEHLFPIKDGVLSADVEQDVIVRKYAGSATPVARLYWTIVDPDAGRTQSTLRELLESKQEED